MTEKEKLELLLARMRLDQGRDGYWYMASPWTILPPDEAIRGAVAGGIWLMDRGIHVLSPIAHTYNFEVIGHFKFKDHSFWMAQDWPLVASSAGVAVLQIPGWDTSKGIGMERQWANDLQKPVALIPWPLVEDVR